VAASYEANYLAYIKLAFPNSFEKWEHFSMARNFVNDATEMQILQKHYLYAGRYGVWREELPLGKVLKAMQAVTKAFVPYPRLYTAAWHVLKLTLPTTDGVPWLLRNPEDLEGPVD